MQIQLNGVRVERGKILRRNVIGMLYNVKLRMTGVQPVGQMPQVTKWILFTQGAYISTARNQYRRLSQSRKRISRRSPDVEPVSKRAFSFCHSVSLPSTQAMTKSMGLFCFSVFFIAYLINGQVCPLAVLIVVYFKESALPFQVGRFHLAVPLKRELQLADQNLQRAAYGPERIFL